MTEKTDQELKKQIEGLNLNEKEIKLLIELEKIRIKKIELSHKCRLKEMEIKLKIAELYRSKKHINKIKKQTKEIDKLAGEKLK